MEPTSPVSPTWQADSLPVSHSQVWNPKETEADSHIAAETRGKESSRAQVVVEAPILAIPKAPGLVLLVWAKKLVLPVFDLCMNGITQFVPICPCLFGAMVGEIHPCCMLQWLFNCNCLHWPWLCTSDRIFGPCDSSMITSEELLNCFPRQLHHFKFPLT